MLEPMGIAGLNEKIGCLEESCAEFMKGFLVVHLISEAVETRPGQLDWGCRRAKRDQ